MEDMDYYEYEESKKRFTPGKIIGFIFKLTAGVIIVGTFALIFGRSFLMKLPKSYQNFTWTESAANAFDNGSLDVLLHTPRDTYDKDGAFHVSDVAISKAAGEVQFTVRYNSRSTLNLLMERYGLTERPKGEVFVYVLTDNNGNTYTDYVYAAASNPMYEFRRVIFKNVMLDGIYLTDEEKKYAESISDDPDAELPTPETTEFYLDIYHRNDVSPDSGMTYSYTVYDYSYGAKTPVYSESGKSDLVFENAPYYISGLTE